MAIRIADETVVSLTDATKYLPRRRKGKKPAVSTLYRWASVGVRGVTLETLQVGGTLCTSMQAMQRFFERLTEKKQFSDSRATVREIRSRAGEEVEGDLEKLGF